MAGVVSCQNVMASNETGAEIVPTFIPSFSRRSVRLSIGRFAKPPFLTQIHGDLLDLLDIGDPDAISWRDGRLRP